MIEEETQEQVRYRYKAYSFRLHKGTKQMLLEGKQKHNLSWNRYIYKLVESYEGTETKPDED